MNYLDTFRLASEVHYDRVVPFRRRRTDCEQANEEAAGQMLSELTDRELDAHINALDAEHAMKRRVLQVAADALARALNERWRRKNG